MMEVGPIEVTPPRIVEAQPVQMLDSTDWHSRLNSPIPPGPGFTELIHDMFLNQFIMNQLPFLTDVTFLLKDGATATAHRLLLALASPFFKAKFCGGWADKLDQVVEMKDIDEDTFSIVIHHIYSPRTVSLDHLEDMKLWDLYYIAEMFLLPSLSLSVIRKLEIAIINLKEKKNLFLHFQKAKVFEILMDRIKQELLKYVGSLLDCNEFLNLPSEIVAEILGWADLMATEGQVFLAASLWCLTNSNSNLSAAEIFARFFKELIQVDYLCEDDLVNIVIPRSHILDRGTLADWIKEVISNKPKQLFRCINLKQKSVVVQLDWISLALLELDGAKTFTLGSPVEFENTRLDGVVIFFSSREPHQISVKCLYVGENARFYVKYKTEQEGSEWTIRDQYKYLTDKMVIPIGKTDLEMGTAELLITVDTRKTVPLRIVKLEDYALDVNNSGNLGEIKQYETNKPLRQVATEESGEKNSRLWFVRGGGFPPIPITEPQTIMGTSFRAYTVADMALYDAQTKSFFILEETSENILPILGNRRILPVFLDENDNVKFAGNISVKTSGSFLKVDDNFVKLVESKCRSKTCEEGIELFIQSPGKVKWSICEGHGLDVNHLDSITVRKFELLRLQRNPLHSSFGQTDTLGLIVD